MFVKLDDGLVATNLDITSRKLAESELLKNYQILQQAEQVARMGSWEYDLVTKNFTWSEGMYGLFNLPKGKPVRPEIYLDYALQADLPIAKKIVRGIKEPSQPFEEILRILVDSQEVTLKIKAIAQNDILGESEKILGVDVDISQVKRLEQENLSMRLQQQQQLLNAILEAQEEERRRISESLHNGVGQVLYATLLSLQRFNFTQLPLSMPTLQTVKTNTEDLLMEAIRDLRRASHELIPILLEEFGLQAAIQHFCERFSHTGINFAYHGFEQRLEKYLELAIYRITQELINNITKHSGATRARVELYKEGSHLILEAQDDGKGIESSARERKGIGLKIISDRVELLRGNIEIESTLGKGTLITITLPLSL
jgi:signal transduction histidine kinase